MLLWLLVVMIALIAVYVLLLRERLRVHPWFAPLYAWLEPIELKLWHGSRTVFLARLVWVPGALISFHDFVLPLIGPAMGLVDWQPISRDVLLWMHVPEQYHAGAVLLFTTLLTRGFETLRKLTASLPTDQPES